MGRATNLKSEQVANLKKRVRLLQTMVDALDEQNADSEALTHLLKMIDNLAIRIRRYREDWENHLTDK